MSFKEAWEAGTPDIPASSAAFTIHSSIRIAAPASLVFRTLRNTDTWRDWNRFVPRVTITFQPPEINDMATRAEIDELIQNTSMRGSVDSDITDGAAPGTHGLTGRAMSLQEEEDVRLVPPPVSLIALRRASAASGMSAGSGISGGKASGIGDRPKSQAGSIGRRKSTQGPTANGTDKLSAAQKYEASQQNRKPSVATGQPSPSTPSPIPILIESPNNPNILVPAPPTPAAKEAEQQQLQARRPSAVYIPPIAKRMISINAIYGEPSVRIQVGTKMLFHCRMKIPSSMALTNTTAMVVTEVSRPDDESDFDHLQRTQTHTLSRSGVYRIVYSMQTSYSPPKSFPRFLLQAQRVHEIRPVMRGMGGRSACMRIGSVKGECWRGRSRRGMRRICRRGPRSGVRG